MDTERMQRYVLTILLVFVGLVGISLWMKARTVNQAVPVAVSQTEVESEAKVAPKDQTVHEKQWLEPNRKFTVHTLYRGSEEIASYKTDLKDKAFEPEGTIPDGTIKFTNAMIKTKGQITYLNQKRHGLMMEYYDSGMTKSVREYSFGELVSVQDYFVDGVLRMEVDYSLARSFLIHQQTGKGFVNYRDGTKRFEWSFVKNEPVGWEKAYNIDGQLIRTWRYDAQGNLIGGDK